MRIRARSKKRDALAAALRLVATSEVRADSVDPEITVAGDSPLNGIFDPALGYDDVGQTAWLAYSAVFGEVSPWGPHVETHVARSEDYGGTWAFEQIVNPSTIGTLELPDGSLLDGVWNAEVASLVHDPDDPGRQWKLFAHRIFPRSEDNFTGEQNVPSHSWIALRTASDPGGLWSEEVALLSSGPLPPAPYDAVQVALNALDPSLQQMLVYSEPGAFYRAGVLYLSLTGLTSTGSDRIVLFASDDHAASWRFVATLLTSSDATAVGYEFFDGSSIAADAGRVFLLVSPGTSSLIHDGTLVFEFESLAEGTLARAAGTPIVRKHIGLQPGFVSERGGGQSTYHARNSSGLLMPQINLPAFPRFFQIFATGERLADSVEVPALGTLGRWLTVAALLAAARFRFRSSANPTSGAHVHKPGGSARVRPGSQESRSQSVREGALPGERVRQMLLRAVGA